MRPVGLFIYMEKPDYLIRIVRLPIDAFVIRLGVNHFPEEVGARHRAAKLVSVFHY